MHFLRLFPAFVQKVFTTISFFQKFIKGVRIRVGGWKIFEKLISGGGRLFGTREYDARGGKESYC